MLHPLSETKRVKKVEFALDAPVDVMIDGEIVTTTVLSLDVLPGAMDVYV
jgi:diacylglycerol kinase family enzyme